MEADAPKPPKAAKGLERTARRPRQSGEATARAARPKNIKFVEKWQKKQLRRAGFLFINKWLSIIYILIIFSVFG
jgi:hypothetical protein